MRSLIVLVTSIATTTGVWVAAPAEGPRALRVGILPTLYRGQNPAIAAAVKGLLLSEMEKQTGIDCELDLALGFRDMARRLAKGEMQFGFCHGFEFAWMHAHDPKVKAMVIAVPVRQPIKAYVAVTDANPAKSLCDLMGKKLANPKSNDPCVKLFADRDCQCGDKDISEIFSDITEPKLAESALHHLYEDKVQAALVDTAALWDFAQRFPARSRHIRMLSESTAFPFSVVVYREGMIDPARVNYFRACMMKARSDGTAKQLLRLLQCAGFEQVSNEYMHQVAECAKRYPPPAGWMMQAISTAISVNDSKE